MSNQVGLAHQPEKDANEPISIMERHTPLKTNMDIQNDGLEKVTPFKHGNLWYLC